MELDYVAKAKTKRNHEKPTETNVNLFTNMDEVEYSSERQRSRSRRRSLKIDVIPVIIIVLLVLLAVASYMLYTAISSEDKGTTNVNTKEEISSLSPRLCGNRSSMCNQGHCAHRSRRIVGGKDATKNDWPWMAEVLIDDHHACGGTLVTNRHILTAAHCLQKVDGRISTTRVTVKLGSINLLGKDSTSHSVCQITVHEDFDSELMVNDIAIVRLQKSISLNETVWPACIPSYEGLRQKPGKFAYMLGWGKSNYSSDFKRSLQQVKVPIVSPSICENRNNNIFPKVHVSTSHNICAGFGKDSPEYGCSGDSGGPLLSMSDNGQWKVDGIMSWGDPSCESDSKDTYTVFTNVARYEKWISETMVM